MCVLGAMCCPGRCITCFFYLRTEWDCLHLVPVMHSCCWQGAETRMGAGLGCTEAPARMQASISALHKMPGSFCWRGSSNVLLFVEVIFPWCVTLIMINMSHMFVCIWLVTALAEVPSAEPGPRNLAWWSGAKLVLQKTAWPNDLQHKIHKVHHFCQCDHS